MVRLWWESSPPRVQAATFLLCPRKKDGVSTVSSYKDANPFVRVPPSWPHSNLSISQRPSLQIPLHWTVGLQCKTLHMGVGRYNSMHSRQSGKFKSSRRTSSMGLKQQRDSVDTDSCRQTRVGLRSSCSGAASRTACAMPSKTQTFLAWVSTEDWPFCFFFFN